MSSTLVSDSKEGEKKSRIEIIKAANEGKKGPLMGRSSRGMKKTDGVCRFKTNFRNTIYLALKNRPGWKITEHELEWDFPWVRLLTRGRKSVSCKYLHNLLFNP